MKTLNKYPTQAYYFCAHSEPFHQIGFGTNWHNYPSAETNYQ